MLEDHDVIFVDFDDLFDPKLFEEEMNSQMDEENLIKLLEENHERKSSEIDEEQTQQPLKKRRGPHPKPMTREQFYKIRPKVPKISKVDPRREYAAAFAEAYNSCDFDVIWEFLSTHSANDVAFIHRWVGKEQYLNFPAYLAIRGIENIAEYWFSRCVVAPDLVVELKETKLYVRSDGFSTVLSSFILHCTRLYDGIMSDSLIVQAAAENADSSASEIDVRSSEESEIASISRASDESKVEIISERVMDKLDQILLNCEPIKQKKKFGLKRKQSEDDVSDIITPITVKTDSPQGASLKKVIPSGTGITIVGTITMQLNKEQKVKQYELTFALKH